VRQHTRSPLPREVPGHRHISEMSSVACEVRTFWVQGDSSTQVEFNGDEQGLGMDMLDPTMGTNPILLTMAWIPNKVRVQVQEGESGAWKSIYRSYSETDFVRAQRRPQDVLHRDPPMAVFCGIIVYGEQSNTRYS